MKHIAFIVTAIFTLSVFSTVCVRAEEKDDMAIAAIEASNGFVQEDGTLIKYEGTEEIVNIPSSINGVAIKAIGSTAFNNNSAIKKIVVPDSVVSIGGIGITDVESEVFAGLTALEAFEVAEGNPSYKSIDGVLFNTKDELVCYPQAKAEVSYLLPEEVKTISKLAFENVKNLETLYVSGDPSLQIWALGIRCNFEVRCYANTKISSYCEQNYVSFSYIMNIGDVDCDGKNTAIDAAIALQKAFDVDYKILTENTYVDADNDGFITSNDAAMIMQSALDGGYEFPVR